MEVDGNAAAGFGGPTMTESASSIAFIMIHPPGNDRAGEQIERARQCGCGREFKQLRVNPGWLNSPGWSAAQKARFREAFEITDTRETWIPKACARCERRALAW